MSLGKGAYWCSRDLDFSPVGNHHFILLVADPSDFQYMGLPAKSEKKGSSGPTTHFYTFGAGSDSSLRLVTAYDNDSDVKSVREYLDADEHTSIFLPDYDLTCRLVSSDINVIRRVALRAVYYQRRQDRDKSSLPYYKLIDDNCAAWVNSMFASLGISEAKRKEIGDQVGFDFGEDGTISLSLFTNPDA